MNTTDRHDLRDRTRQTNCPLQAELGAAREEPASASLRASDGYELRYRHWVPSNSPPAGYVLALHGIQSHSGWYEFSSETMCRAGFDVTFPDRRGSGLNEKDRGHACHAERLINDVTQFLLLLDHRRKGQAPQAPLILLGISWGGKLAVAVTARRPHLVDRLALLYPGLRPRVRPNLFQRFLLRLATWAGAARRTVSIPLGDPALFTAQADWQRFIHHDQLALRRASVGLLAASCRLDNELRHAPQRIICPVLLMLAGRDRIIDNAATHGYVQRFASVRKTVLSYPEAAHTLEFEPNRAEIFAELIRWMTCGSARAEEAGPREEPGGELET